MSAIMYHTMHRMGTKDINSMILMTILHRSTFALTIEQRVWNLLSHVVDVEGQCSFGEKKLFWSSDRLSR